MTLYWQILNFDKEYLIDYLNLLIYFLLHLVNFRK